MQLRCNIFAISLYLITNDRTHKKHINAAKTAGFVLRFASTVHNTVHKIGITNLLYHTFDIVGAKCAEKKTPINGNKVSN